MIIDAQQKNFSGRLSWLHDKQKRRKQYLFATPRCVNGIPSSAAIPDAAVIPERQKDEKKNLMNRPLHLQEHA